MKTILNQFVNQNIKFAITIPLVLNTNTLQDIVISKL